MRGPDGEPIPFDSGERKTTLRDICEQALLATHADERDLAVEKKVERYNLFNLIHDADVVLDLEAEQVSLIKTLIGKTFNVLIVGRAFDAIEGRTASAPGDTVDDPDDAAADFVEGVAA